MIQPQPPAPAGNTDSGAITALVLGIVGLVIPPLFVLLGPIALAVGSGAKKRIAASGGTIQGEGVAQAGYILGIIGTVLAGLLIIFFGICIAAFSTMGY